MAALHNSSKPDKQPMLLYVQTCTEMKGVVLTGILRWLISLRLADAEQLANAKVVVEMIARFLGAFAFPPWWGVGLWWWWWWGGQVVHAMCQFEVCSFVSAQVAPPPPPPHPLKHSALAFTTGLGFLYPEINATSIVESSSPQRGG